MEFNWEVLLRPESLIALGTLTLLEIILGIDNILFISIISERLPVEQRPKARVTGLALALIFRLLLLMMISWLVHFTDPLFTLFEIPFSGRDLILLGGGIFLLVKTISEIHGKLEGEYENEASEKKKPSFASTLVQIVLIDIVFSFDSILTAVGLSNHLEIMITAVVISMSLMMVYSRHISIFINRRPTLKMLALCFLIMIGALLVAEAFDVHVPKATVYFGMVFALLVEFLNQKMRKKAKPIKLRGPLNDEINNMD